LFSYHLWSKAPIFVKKITKKTIAYTISVGKYCQMLQKALYIFDGVKNIYILVAENDKWIFFLLSILFSQTNFLSLYPLHLSPFFFLFLLFCLSPPVPPSCQGPSSGSMSCNLVLTRLNSSMCRRRMQCKIRNHVIQREGQCRRLCLRASVRASARAPVPVPASVLESQSLGLQLRTRANAANVCAWEPALGSAIAPGPVPESQSLWYHLFFVCFCFFFFVFFLFLFHMI
jgi:hypothetical protein